MFNKAIVIGRLTRDPELRYTPSGKAVAKMTVAVDRGVPRDGDKHEADFIDTVVWDKLAETCAQYLAKGRQVLVEGRIQTRVYETQDGRRRKVTEVVASNVRFLGGKTNGSGNGGANVNGTAPGSNSLGEDVPPPDEESTPW